MKAILRTWNNKTDYSDKIVEISDKHEFSDGPYGDTVPFSVGSNQAILPYENVMVHKGILQSDIDFEERMETLDRLDWERDYDANFRFKF